jgi:crotonobetainyl-CoA:carnitine CoA-transferase CaiB-like acyl-CoA transferase
MQDHAALPSSPSGSPAHSLQGIRVLDLSRVLAGPWCTQVLADLGADVIKIERAGAGDDTRTWGPPFLKDRDGHDSGEAAYYLAANRNKRSVTCDIATRWATCSVTGWITPACASSILRWSTAA